MDFYLQPGNSYKRLEDEFKKYGKLIFCVDFDDTIYDFHKKGRMYGNMISYLKEVNLEDRIHVNGASVGDVGKTLNLRVENIDSETLLLMLDAKGVCISAGSACHSHKSEPSRVLTAMGLSDDEARDSVRISFSSTNTPAEVEEAAAIFSSCIEALAGLQR